MLIIIPGRLHKDLQLNLYFILLQLLENRKRKMSIKTPALCDQISCISIQNEQLQVAERWLAVKCLEKLGFPSPDLKIIHSGKRF